MNTTYYGCRYRSVFRTTSRKRANIVAHVIGLYFSDDYGVRCARGHVVGRKHKGRRGMHVFIDHREGNGETLHVVFVKEPFDKIIRKVYPETAMEGSGSIRRSICT